MCEDCPAVLGAQDRGVETSELDSPLRASGDEVDSRAKSCFTHDSLISQTRFKQKSEHMRISISEIALKSHPPGRSPTPSMIHIGAVKLNFR